MKHWPDDTRGIYRLAVEILRRTQDAEDALNELREKHRIVLLLRDVEGLSTEETAENLEEATGCSYPAVRDMNQSMAKHGVAFSSPIRIVELCKAEYAEEVLNDNPEFSTLMPCAWGVYEGSDGKLHLSRMNAGLMGKMFGGTISRVMEGRMAKDKQAILENVVQ